MDDIRTDNQQSSGAVVMPKPGTAGAPADRDYDPEGFFTPAVIRHNMKVVILLEAIILAGQADMALALQPLLNYLTKDLAVVGAVMALSWASVAGVIFSPFITRRFPYKKWYYIAFGVASSLALLALGVMLIGSPMVKPSLFALLIASATCICVYYLLFGFTQLPHNEFLAACIPPSHRGRMFGISLTVYAVITIALTALGGYLLKVLPKPASYGYIFAMTCGIWLTGFALCTRAREKRTPVEKSPKPWTRAMLIALWNDKPYLHFLLFLGIAQLTLNGAMMLMPNFGMKELGMSDTTFAFLMGLTKFAILFTSAPAGWLADRYSAKRVILWALPLLGVAYLVAYFFYIPTGIMVSYTMLWIVGSAYSFCVSILSVSIPKPEHRAGHFTIQNMMSLTLLALAPLWTGLLCKIIAPRTLILLTAIFAFVDYH